MPIIIYGIDWVSPRNGKGRIVGIGGRIMLNKKS
jgi:hypothetical protein